MVTLKDIAAELGVSVSLVSRVLSGRMGSSGASQASIAAIRHQAQKRGYRKHSSASALRSGRQNVVGLFIHKLGAEGSGLIEDLVDGVAAATRAHGQRLHLAFYTTEAELQAVFEGAHANMLDGLLVGGIAHRELADRLRRLDREGLPIVTIHEEPIHPALPNVGTDQHEVSRLATQHLVDCGCRRLGMLGGVGKRGQGFLDVLRRHGLRADPKRIVQCGSQRFYEEGEQAAQAFLSAAVDGVYAQSDQMAAGVLNGLLRAGARVPEDVKVIGVDDAPFCRFACVSLSSVYQDHHTCGRAALDLLMQRLDGKQVQSLTIAPVLRARASTGAGVHGKAARRSRR